MSDSAKVPKLYNDLSFFQGRIVISGEDRAVEVGGLLYIPKVALSYLLAARRLIWGDDSKSLSEVALPISYLQRHAFEVALKDLIDTARDIARNTAWVVLLESDSAAECPADPPEIKPGDPAWTHDLPKLVNILGQDLVAVGHEPPPPEIEAMATTLRNAEHDQPDRLRYAKVKGKMRSDPPAWSFTTEHQLLIEATQRSLEALFERHLWFRGIDEACSPEANFLETVEMNSYGLTQGLGALLDSLGRSV